MKPLSIKSTLFLPAITALTLLAAAPKGIPVPEDWRDVGGTNYNVGYLTVWWEHSRQGQRPLPAWEKITGNVDKVTADGVVVQTRILRMVPSKPDRLSRIGGSTGGLNTPNYTLVDGPKVFLVRHPQHGTLVVGGRIECFAMVVGNHNLRPGEQVKKMDYGDPIKRPKPAAKD